MSSRRLARAKRNPAFERPVENDPNRCGSQIIEHPTLGRVRLSYGGSVLRRIRTEHPPFPPDQQNFFSPLSTGGKFEQLLEVLGISR